MPPIDAIIFDCDGTLVDSEPLSLQVLIDYVGEFELVLSHEEMFPYFAGNDLKVVVEQLQALTSNPFPSDFIETFRQRQLTAIEQSCQPIAGVEAIIESLVVPYCVASNAPHFKIKACLEATDLQKYFAAEMTFSAYDVNAWKPDPALFLLASERLETPPANCLVVEDSVYGVEAGINAGMQVVGFDPAGTMPRKFTDVKYVQSMAEISTLIQ
jgi:HAD superfamily hydrolase (TIGR01509 family)